MTLFFSTKKNPPFSAKIIFGQNSFGQISNLPKLCTEVWTILKNGVTWVPVCWHRAQTFDKRRSWVWNLDRSPEKWPGSTRQNRLWTSKTCENGVSRTFPLIRTRALLSRSPALCAPCCPEERSYLRKPTKKSNFRPAIFDQIKYLEFQISRHISENKHLYKFSVRHQELKISFLNIEKLQYLGVYKDQL